MVEMQDDHAIKMGMDCPSDRDSMISMVAVLVRIRMVVEDW